MKVELEERDLLALLQAVEEVVARVAALSPHSNHILDREESSQLSIDH